MFPGAVAQKLQSGPVVLHLPQQVWQRDQEQQGDAAERPAGEEQPTLGGEQQAKPDSQQKESHGGLVEQANSGGHAKDRPPNPRGPPALQKQEGQNTSHPEHRLKRVHGEKSINADELRAHEKAEHGQGLGGPPAAHRPGNDAGEKDRPRPGNGRQDSNGKDGVPEEPFAQPGLQGYNRPVVHIPPSQVAATRDVIELIPEVAIAEMQRPQGKGKLQE